MARLLISHFKKFQQTGWGVGHCLACGQFEVVQIRDVIEVTTLYFVPVRRKVVGQQYACDFCEREIYPQLWRDAWVERERWCPSDGLAALWDRLGLRGTKALPATTDTRLRSLLDAVEAATSLKKMNAMPGTVAGASIGLAVGVLLGWVAESMGIMLGVRDPMGLCGVFGGVIGAVVGAVIYIRLAGNRLATRRLIGACQKYRLDRFHLLDLAAKFNSERVRRAALACRDSPDGDPR